MPTTLLHLARGTGPGSALVRATLLLIVAAFCAGCGATPSRTGASGPPPGGPSARRAWRLGCTIPTYGHPFFVAMKRGLEEEARAAGVTLTMVDGKDDSQTQLTAIDNFIVQKVDAIVLCPTESETLVPGVEKANRAGIPVITVNRTVAADVVTYVGADDTEGGRLQGRAIVEALPNGGKILLLQGILGSSPQRNREAGLEEVLKEHPRHRIVQKIPYRFQRALAVSAMETALLQYPKGSIDAVVAQSDDGALAAADVCRQRGRTELVIVGFNGESDAFDAVRDGRIYATVLQDAETQGREAIRATLQHLEGKRVPKQIITPLYRITRENVDRFRPAWESSR